MPSPVPDSQKKALRDYYNSQVPHPKQRTCRAWFHETYNRRLAQSAVSKILSEEYEYLDAPNIIPSTKPTRARPSLWPTMETKLLEWLRSMHAQNQMVTGDMILAQAKQIWPQIEEYQGQPMPAFSEGWLARFKKRHNLNRHNLHGEVPLDPQPVARPQPRPCIRPPEAPQVQQSQQVQQVQPAPLAQPAQPVVSTTSRNIATPNLAAMTQAAELLYHGFLYDEGATPEDIMLVKRLIARLKKQQVPNQESLGTNP